MCVSVYLAKLDAVVSRAKRDQHSLSEIKQIFGAMIANRGFDSEKGTEEGSGIQGK